MYIVTKNGKKLPVDDSSIDYENDYIPMLDSVTMVSAQTEVRKYYLLTLCDKPWDSRSTEPANVITEVIFDHYPTKEEILFNFAKYNIGIKFGYAQVNEIYQYGCWDD